MIDTIFYYAENLPFEQYQLELGIKIAGRTIVFAAALKAIYKDGVRYNSIDYDELKEKISQILIENSYVLPTASTTTKGGIKIGAGLKVTDDTLDVDFTKFGDIPEGLETIIANIIYQHIDELRGPQGPKGDKGDPGTGGESIDYSITSLGVNGKTITLNQNNNDRSPLSVDITTAVNNVINNSTIGGKTEVIVTPLLTEGTPIAMIRVDDADAKTIYAPSGSSDPNNPGSGVGQDPVARQQIVALQDTITTLSNTADSERGRLDDLLDTLNTRIGNKVDLMIVDSAWLDAYAPGIVAHSGGAWDEKAEAWIQLAGIWTDADGVTKKTWTQFVLKVNTIELAVNALSSDGDITEALLSSINQAVQDGIASLNLETMYAKKDAERVIEWMYSGLLNQTSSEKSFNEIVSAGKNEMHNGIAELRTYVEKLKSGEYVATASLEAKVDTAIAGIKADATSKYATTQLFNKIDTNSDNIAGILTGITGDSSTVNIATRINEWKAGVITQSDLTSATSGLVAANDYNAATITAMVNEAGSSVNINASKITLDGDTFVKKLVASEAFINYLTAGTATFTGNYGTSDSEYAMHIEPYGNSIGHLYIGSAPNLVTNHYFDLFADDYSTHIDISGNKSITETNLQDESWSGIRILSKVNAYVNQLMVYMHCDQNRYIRLDTDNSNSSIPYIRVNSAEGYSIINAGSDYSYTSDIRYKNVIENLNTTVEQIAEAPLFRYTTTTDSNNKVKVGTSAQYWLNIIPEAVSEDSEGRLSLAYATVATASAITVAKEVVTLKNENTALRERVEALEARLQLIESKLNA